MLSYREGMIILCFWALCLSGATSQPVSCTDGDHCSLGYFCDTEVGECKECLRCEDLKREPLLSDNTCVTSIDKCGECFKGFVVDRLSDVNAPCVVPGSSESIATPNYVYWLIGVGVIVFLTLTIGIIVYIWMNPGVFKLGGNCPSGTVSANILMAPRPSAPAEAPPPYTLPNVPYSAVRTESPFPTAHEAGEVYEEDGLLIKPQSQTQHSGNRVAGAKQAASVFNVPIYDRQEPAGDETPPVVTEVIDDPAIHEEPTMSSLWTPNEPSNGDINANVSGATVGASEPGGAPAGLSAQLAAARDTTLIEPAPKRMRVASPNSNNDSRDSGHGDDKCQSNFSSTRNGPSCNFQINVVQYNQIS